MLLQLCAMDLSRLNGLLCLSDVKDGRQHQTSCSGLNVMYSIPWGGKVNTAASHVWLKQTLVDGHTFCVIMILAMMKYRVISKWALTTRGA